MIKRLFPNWDLLRKSKMCRWCPDDSTWKTLRLKVGSVDVWVCRNHTDEALDEVIEYWKEVK